MLQSHKNVMLTSHVAGDYGDKKYFGPPAEALRLVLPAEHVATIWILLFRHLTKYGRRW